MIRNSFGSGRSLPDGWVEAPIGEIADLLRGVSYKKAVARETAEDGYKPILRATNIQGEHLILDSDLVYVPDEYIKPEQRLRVGDVVVCMSSGSKHLVGKTGQLVREWNGSFGAFCAAIRFDSGIEPSFAGFFFASNRYRNSIREKSSGVNINNLRHSDIETLLFPIPPSAEQRRIVAAIETQFTRLDAGVAALERARANLKRYRAAVLKAACEGRLVPTEAALARAEGRDYEPAGQLLARILAERRTHWQAAHPGKRYIEPAPPDTGSLLELPEGWVWVNVEQLISGFRSGSTAVPGDEPTDYPILRSSSVRPLKVDYEDVRFVMEAESRNADNFLQEGDLLFTRLSGSLDYVGNCALVKGSGFRGIQHPDRLFKARLVEPSMGQYVEVCFASPQLRKKVMSKAKSTAGHQRVSMGGITEQVLPLPPLPEQHRIVAEVERWLSVAAALEREVEAALARAARLRQSILKRAFEGRLVPQDPNDEPASALLERIRAAREAPATGGKKRRTRQMPLPMM